MDIDNIELVKIKGNTAMNLYRTVNDVYEIFHIIMLNNFILTIKDSGEDVFNVVKFSSLEEVIDYITCPRCKSLLDVDVEKKLLICPSKSCKFELMLQEDDNFRERSQ